MLAEAIIPLESLRQLSVGPFDHLSLAFYCLCTAFEHLSSTWRRSVVDNVCTKAADYKMMLLQNRTIELLDYQPVSAFVREQMVLAMGATDMAEAVALHQLVGRATSECVGRCMHFCRVSTAFLLQDSALSRGPPRGTAFLLCFHCLSPPRQCLTLRSYSDHRLSTVLLLAFLLQDSALPCGPIERYLGRIELERRAAEGRMLAMHKQRGVLQVVLSTAFPRPFNCLSLPYLDLLTAFSLPFLELFHCLSSTFHCLPSPFHCLFNALQLFNAFSPLVPWGLQAAFTRYSGQMEQGVSLMQTLPFPDLPPASSLPFLRLLLPFHCLSLTFYAELEQLVSFLLRKQKADSAAGGTAAGEGDEALPSATLPRTPRECATAFPSLPSAALLSVLIA